MEFKDLKAYGQPHTCTIIGRTLPMEPLKGFEDFIKVYFIKPDSVVFHMYFMKPISGGWTAADPDYMLPAASVFQRVADCDQRRAGCLKPDRKKSYSDDYSAYGRRSGCGNGRNPGRRSSAHGEGRFRLLPADNGCDERGAGRQDRHFG